MAREFWSSPRIQIQSICTGLTHIKPRVWSPDKMVESKRSNLKKQMRKLKSQIIYSFVRVDTVLNRTKYTVVESLAQNLQAFQSQQGFPCLICADLMPIFYWLTHTDTENPLLWLQYVENSVLGIFEFTAPFCSVSSQKWQNLTQLKRVCSIPWIQTTVRAQQLTFGLDAFKVCSNRCV